MNKSPYILILLKNALINTLFQHLLSLSTPVQSMMGSV